MRQKRRFRCVSLPEAACQLEVPLAIVRTLDRFEHQVAETKPQIHRWIAEVACLVIDECKTMFMCKNIFRTVIAVTQGIARRHQPIDQRLHSVGHFGAAFLNATIVGIHTQLHKDVAIGKWSNEMWVPRRGFVDASENAADVLTESKIDIAG